jgi:hypothetical protein
MIDEPKFDELCRLIGLAILMSQKIQFSLAHYLVYHKMRHAGLSRIESQQLITKLLSKTLGAVISQVRSEAPLEAALTEKLDALLQERNWLAHNFDQEATPIIAAGKDFNNFNERMAGITIAAHDLMVELDQVGKCLASKEG